MVKPKKRTIMEKPMIHEKVITVRCRATALSIPSERSKSIAECFTTAPSFSNELINNSANTMKKIGILIIRGKRADLNGHFTAVMAAPAKIISRKKLNKFLPLKFVRFTEILPSKFLLNKGIESNRYTNQKNNDDTRLI